MLSLVLALAASPLQYQLDNGLTVVLDADPDAAQVAINVGYGVGSIADPPGRAGLAHFVEHMMFHEAGTLGTGELSARLEAQGAIVVNAITTFDRTEYFAVLLPAGLEEAIALEAERMGSMGSAVRSDRVEDEKRIVENELFDRIYDGPFGFAEMLAHELGYPEDHPMRRLPIGTLEDIDAITVEDVRAFHRGFYVPANATLVIVGNFDVERVRGVVAAKFGALPKATPERGPNVPWPKIPKRAIEAPDWVASRPRISLRWPLRNLNDTDRAALEVLSSMIGSARVSRGALANLKDESIHRLTATVMDVPEGPYFRLDAWLAPGSHVEVARNRLLGVLQTYGSVPPTKAELKGTKRMMRLAVSRALADLAARASAYQWSVAKYGDAARVSTLADAWDAVDARAVQGAVARHLEGRHLVVVGRPVRK